MCLARGNFVVDDFSLVDKRLAAYKKTPHARQANVKMSTDILTI